jgi:YidC/Oxa1 family membrane protein insertase
VIPSANIFQPLIDVFESVLTFFHDSVGVGWGMSIICLTVVVRAALIPLTLKQFRSMQALQRLAPEIKALQAKYKDDRQKLNQEMMKFYQENKVNPFGSCLPLLLQLPVFLSLFYMLRKDLKLDICGDELARHFHVEKAADLSSKLIQKTPCDEVAHNAGNFLFIPDLTDKATGGVLVALIVLYIGSQLASSLLMSATTADRNQRMLMIGLPFLFTAFIVNFPAGLIVYWITTNLWTIVQQWIVRRTVGHPQAVPAGAAAAVGGGGGGGRATRGSPAEGKAKNEGKEEPVAAGSRERSGPPPPPPRKKKKRSGRRR